MRMHISGGVSGKTLLAACCVMSLCAALAQAAAPTLKAQQGTATVTVGEDEFKLDATSPPRELVGGENISTGKKSVAVVEVCRDCLLFVDEKTTVVLREIKPPKGKVAGVVRLELKAGSVRSQCCRPEPKKGEVKKEKKKFPVVSFEVKVGEMTARGRSFSGHITRLPERAYEAGVTCGLMTLEHGKLLAVLQGKQSLLLKRGSFTVTADAENEGYVTYSYVGAVVMLLAPGQSVLIEPTEDGKAVFITNLDPSRPLYATSWDGIIMDQLTPGRRKLYGVLEPVVSYMRAMAHISTLSNRLMRFVMEIEVLPEEVRPPVLPRTERVSPAD